MPNLLNVLAVADIVEKLTNLFYNLIDMGYNFLINLDWWIQAIILLLTAFLLIMGLIYFVIKSWKFVIVLLVLGGIGFLVYYFLIRKDGGQQETEAIIGMSKLLISLF